MISNHYQNPSGKAHSKYGTRVAPLKIQVLQQIAQLLNAFFTTPSSSFFNSCHLY